MTLRRVCGSWEAVLVSALHDLTSGEIEAATGKSRDTLEKISRTTNNLGLHFSDAARLDAALLAKNLPPRFLPLFQDILGPLPAPASANIEQGLRRLTVEVGEVNGAVDRAMADGKLEPSERHAIAKELHDVIDKARETLAAVEAPAVQLRRAGQ